MADITLSPSQSKSIWRPQFGKYVKRFVAILVSYEVAAYGLATVQAVGLTLPTMVNASPAIAHDTCRTHQLEILNAAEKWKARHPGFLLHRPRLGELARYFDHGLPTCPDGGAYEMVYPGHTIRVEGAPVAVVPTDRVGVRCRDAKHGATLSSPFRS